MTAVAEAPTAQAQAAITSRGAVTSRVHARVGLLGNPSDGFYGRTISFSLANFYAQARRAALVAPAAAQLRKRPATTSQHGCLVWPAGDADTSGHHHL